MNIIKIIFLLLLLFVPISIVYYSKNHRVFSCRKSRAKFTLWSVGFYALGFGMSFECLLTVGTEKILVWVACVLCGLLFALCASSMEDQLENLSEWR